MPSAAESPRQRALPSSALWLLTGAAVILLIAAALELTLPSPPAAPASATASNATTTEIDPAAPLAAAERAAADVARAVTAAGDAADPAALRAVIEPLLRHLDLPYITSLLLGRRWGSADPGQRLVLQGALVDYLIARHAPALQDLRGWRLRALPDQVRLLPGPYPRARVPVLVAADGLPALRMELHLRRRDGVWRLYDASLFGVGLIGLKRPVLDRLAGGHGLDALVALLRQPQPEAAPAG
jgi:ABC-type transporter MlaC component